MAIPLNSLVQVGEVHVRLGSRRILGRSGGKDDGSCLAWGALEKKVERRSRERSSAKSLCMPGTCLAVSSNWYDASKKNKQRRRCMRL